MKRSAKPRLGQSASTKHALAIIEAGISQIVAGIVQGRRRARGRRTHSARVA